MRDYTEVDEYRVILVPCGLIHLIENQDAERTVCGIRRRKGWPAWLVNTVMEESAEKFCKRCFGEPDSEYEYDWRVDEIY